MRVNKPRPQDGMEDLLIYKCFDRNAMIKMRPDGTADSLVYKLSCRAYQMMHGIIPDVVFKILLEHQLVIEK